MFREFLVRIRIDQKTRDVVVISINSLMARETALETYGADTALVLKDLTGAEIYDHGNWLPA